ncbi:hydantoinase/oxoprolinase family protein [Halomicrobium sp. LC1Hm]|uniref:hydantoinase/oxoprolinase family protein n=1 Tax=Halomicrobium sp. LC1Hm TaxID=2610902 RepID=UPI0012983396|nr:hydantoinase/oxoprolinase family protein [Halomicrobium sp. LC1Hm]QGA83631.1 N-methylhydantoinase B/acetone carboxylase, beta subunit [Halomicrobium sp. LC1Hm]
MDETLLGVDVGGTFTDVVVVADGRLTTAKVPTTADQSEGVLDGVERACDRAGVGATAVDRFRHATTVAVNAMLERSGATTALVTTEGFADVLAIGRQDRPSLYDLDARGPTPLVPAARRYELDERATTDGIERSVDPDEVRALATEIDADAVAVAFLHAYAHPENERRAAAILRSELDVPVSASHEVLSEFREYERTATTVADAVLTPVVDDYLDRLADRATDSGLPAPRVMQANGGIADPATVRERAVTTVMSGPAAGVVGAAAFEPDDADGVITFDMGGTSSDVSLVRDGSVERTTEAAVGGHPIRIPMVDVETVGAGGGSIASVDAGGALRVGPASAGADPGPACYGRGGTEPTVTDAALVLGYLGSDTTLGADLGLDADAAVAALEDLATAADLDGPVDAARGVFRVANATMTRAIRGVTTERGHDPRRFALATFGGAGPMHAAPLADRLGVDRVVVPRASGVLSAFGLLAAAEHHDAVRTHRTTLGDATRATIEDLYEDLRDRVRADVSDPGAATYRRQADLRYVGQSHELTVDVSEPFRPADLRERFHAAHERARDYRLDDEPVELVNCRVTATIEGTAPERSFEGSGEPRVGTREAVFGDGRRETPIYDWPALVAERPIDGPAIVEGGESTVVCPPGWTLVVDDEGTISLEGSA